MPVGRKTQHIRWDAGGRHVVRVGQLSLAWPSVGRYVQVGIIAGVALLALFLLLTMAPSASVVAYPPTETVSQVITITASESRTEVNLQTLEVPARRVTAEKTFTLALKPTGTTQVGTVPAKARVTMSNSTQAAVVVAQGSVVLAGPEFFPFTVDETVTVPAAGAAEAAVTAVRSGVQGNVPAGTIVGWQAERLRFLKLTNAAPAAGGVSEPRPAVDPRDAIALAELAKALDGSDSVKKSLVEARPRDAVFMGTASSEIETGEVRPAVGAPTDLVLLDVVVRLSALAVVESTLDEVARHVLGSADTGGEFVPGTVRAVETGARLLDADSATIRTELLVQGELARGLSAAAVRQAVLGKSKEDARSTLLERYGIQDADVQLSGWAPRLPRFGFRVDVALAVREATNGSGFTLPNGTTNTTTATTPSTASPGPR